MSKEAREHLDGRGRSAVPEELKAHQVRIENKHPAAAGGRGVVAEFEAVSREALGD